MLLHKTVEHDARVRREARALAEAGHEVVVVHLPRPADPPATTAAAEGYELRSAAPPDWAERLPGRLRRSLAAARIAQVAARVRADVVHAHDAAMLLPGWIVAMRTRSGLVYDSHELATGVPYHSRGWYRLVSTIERLIVPRCDAVITVSDGIAERLRERYGLQRTPTVVRNLPDLPPPGEGGEVEDLRASLGIGEAPLVLHHGAAAQDRGGEALIRSMAELDGAHLLFLGADGGYADGLSELSAQLGLGPRVHFRAPVPLAELLSYSAQADVGVTLLEDSCENHRLALPNKAFEYVAAGIPVVASDLPELSRVVEGYGIGWTVDPADPASIAGGLSTALGAGDDPQLRERLERAAAELSWSRERERLVDLYAELELARTTATRSA
jgi:glycosyltransferase involved in cell wall biosynthesis